MDELDDIRSFSELGNWLETNVPELATTIATRGALHTLPAVFTQLLHLPEDFDDKTELQSKLEEFVLLCCQATLRASVSCYFQVSDNTTNWEGMSNRLQAATRNVGHLSPSYEAASAILFALMSLRVSRDVGSSCTWTFDHAFKVENAASTSPLFSPPAMADEALDPTARLMLVSLGSHLRDTRSALKGGRQYLLTDRLFAKAASHYMPTATLWKTVTLTRHTPATWSFWIDWYQGFLDGKPLDWDLQRRVALIDDSVWNAGPVTVADEIARICEDYYDLTPAKERYAELEPKSVSHLFENRIIASSSLQGLAAQVIQSIERFHAETGANALPEALEPLAALPALLLAVNSTIQDAPSDRAIASETENQLRAEIGRLNAKVAQLENELQKASAAKPSVFSDAFKKQLGTSLGGWQLYAALCTGLWFVSGDIEGMQRRLENISNYRNIIFGDVSSPSIEAPANAMALAGNPIEI